MKFPKDNRLVSCNFLFQFVIFTAGLYSCNSVTYVPSIDRCKANQIKQRCQAFGNSGAKIKDSTTLDNVKKAITDGDEYWTALSWHKNNYYWYQGGQLATDVEESIVDTAGTTENKWYCFVVNETDGAKLKARQCQQNSYKYICEENSLTSTELTASSHIVTTTWTEPTSTEALEISTSNALKLTVLTTLQFLQTATTASVSSPGLNTQPVTSTLISNLVITSSRLTTSKINVLESSTLDMTTSNALTTLLQATTAASNSGLITPAVTSTLNANQLLTSSRLTASVTNVMESSTSTVAASSTTEGSNKNTTTPEKQTAKKKIQLYFAEMGTLNATNKSSLQIAANITSNFLKALKEDQTGTNEINVLLATQELESFAISYGRIHYKANESTVISQEHYEMKIQKVPADNKDAVVFAVNNADYSAGEGRASISLPSTIFKGQDVVVVSIVYNDIDKWVPDEEHVELDGKTFTNLELGSRIIASTVHPKLSGVLDENVTISFSYDKELKEQDMPHCMFWNFKIKSKLNGSWSSTGCSMIKSVSQEITCSCNHLTNFAVLMQVRDKKVPSEHKVALEVITYVGCALSLAGEVLTVIAYVALMNLKQEQIQIRLNLVLAIAIAQVAFLSGINASQTKGVCVFVAALIHYFYLAGFAWMMFEGVYLYLMIVKVFNTVVRMRLFYAVAWGVSLVIVVLSIVIASTQDGGVHSYVHGDYCWVSFTNNLIWTFVTPVLAVCLVNAVILGRVVHEILRMQSDKTSQLEGMRQGAKACVVLFPLLGMTWVFGILSVTEAGLAFQYIFTIFNSLQGFFIFVLHVLRNGDVRTAFHRKKQKWKEAKSITSSRTTHQHSSDLWTNPKATSDHDTHELATRRNQVTPRSSDGHENSIGFENPRCMTPAET